MKKGIGILLLGLVLLLAACGDDETKEKAAESSYDMVNITLDKTKVTAGLDDTYTVTGKTSPGASINIGTVFVKADKDGKFSLKHAYESDGEYELLANKKGMAERSALITVTQPADVKTKKKELNDAANEQTRKDIDAATNAVAKAEQSNSAADVKNAKTLVSKTPPNVAEELTTRLDDVESKIAEASSKTTAKNNASEISYNMLKKNADTYMGKPYYAKGEVIQAIEDGGTTLLRVNITQGDYVWDDTVAVIYDGITDAVEDDIIEVYGTIYGNYSYDTTIGGSATIPGITASSITVVK